MNFLSPLSFLKQKIAPQYLGVDIGTNSIKIAEVVSGGDLPRLVNYSLLDNERSLISSNSALQTSGLKIFDDEVADFLKTLLRKMKPRTTDAVASLPTFSAFMTVLNFPAMSPQEIDKIMRFQAKQYIPLPLSEVTLEWSKVGEYENEKGSPMEQILLTSVPQENIRKYEKIFKGAGLTLRSLEIENLSLVRSLLRDDPATAIILDIGSYSSTITVAAGGELKFANQSDYAGTSLTKALATSLNINPLRAEELKKEKGIIEGGANYELSTILLPILDVIINEVKRAQSTYESQFPGAPKIEKVILSGGGSNLLGIEKYMTSQLAMKAEKAAPFSSFEYDPLIEPLVRELNPLMSVALGLGLSQFKTHATSGKSN